MKKSELFFSALQVPVDFVMIVMAAITAYVIRDIPQIVTLQPKLYNFPFNIYIKVILMVAPIFVFIYAINGLYDIRSTRKFWKETLKVFNATSIGLVIIIVAIFLKREWFSSRFIILAAWSIAVFYVVSARYFIQLIQKWLLRNHGIGVHRLLLIGSNGKLDAISKLIKSNKNLGYRIVDKIGQVHLREIKSIKQERGIDEVILCEPSMTDDEQEKLVDYCAINNIKYKFIPTILQTSKYEIGMLSGEPLIEVHNTPLDGWGRIIKRIFDVTGATVAIIVFGPLMILIAVISWIECGRPVIFRNERVGHKGIFDVLKFRYMKKEYCHGKQFSSTHNKKALNYLEELISEKSIKEGPLYKIKNDPRKTKFGSFLERYSLDELPQFFNVLIGNMSLVGPRPHQPIEVSKYMEYHRRLLTIKPGVTGMAQVSGRSDLEFEDEYRLDLYYIENWSLWLDIQIILKTLGVLFRKRRNL